MGKERKGKKEGRSKRINKEKEKWKKEMKQVEKERRWKVGEKRKLKIK